jgi:DNA-binding MarR family transcriptional regulator
MHENVLLNLLKGVYWFDDALQDNLEAQGFPRASRAISFILLNIAHGENHATKIAKNLGISRQAVSHMLTELRSRGMLVMKTDPNDKRSQVVNFSPGFSRMGAACAEVLNQLEKELSGRIGVRGFESLQRTLSADWGAPPMLGELSGQEIAHGRKLWEEDKEKQRRPRRVGKARRGSVRK